jgi:hypothetical protein
VNAHPAAALFPLMDGFDLRQLADDISTHGLIEPIVLCDGQVLDGRNRLRACEIAGVEPSFVEWQSNGVGAVEWVVAKNLHRRHLTTAQRAVLALDLLPHLEAEAKERQRGGQGGVLLPPLSEEAKGESVEKAADLVGIGRTTVSAAKAIQNRDPEIVNRMRSGELNVAQASRAAGFEAMANNHPPVSDDAPAIYYGKGDKWRESSEPLRRYLAAWKKRGYSFGHIAPREARKRVETIDSLIEELTEARADLAQRSHSYRLTV